MSLKVLIADDHSLLAEAVSSMLNANPSFEAVTTESYQGVLSYFKENSDVDIVLLDLRMPGMSGLESVVRVVSAAGDAKVVLFTGQVDRHFLKSALDSGCKGLIPKTMPLKSLVSVLHLIMSGQIFVPVDEDKSKDQKPVPGDLNDKEIFVLRMASEGMTNKEIARSMDNSEMTVKMHMRSICKKLEARNRAHATMVARERALI